MKRLAMQVGVCVAALGLAAAPAGASHSWRGFHWARTANPFTVRLGDNVSSSWDSYLRTAASDWTRSSVLDTRVVGGRAGSGCAPTSGRVEVCSGQYGNTGWLGVAQVWLVSGTHITRGTVRLNDSYFSQPRYNNASERLHVVCQEVGHTFGLDHQSTTGASLNTCMDYYVNTSSSDTRSTHPNAHDYDELALIYAHLDSTRTLGATSVLPDVGPVSPGALAAPAVYETQLAGGVTRVTFVLWVDPARALLGAP
jgi:hypothetical protein